MCAQIRDTVTCRASLCALAKLRRNAAAWAGEPSTAGDANAGRSLTWWRMISRGRRHQLRDAGRCDCAARMQCSRSEYGGRGLNKEELGGNGSKLTSAMSKSEGNGEQTLFLSYSLLVYGPVPALSHRGTPRPSLSLPLPTPSVSPLSSIGQHPSLPYTQFLPF